jgi:hypothetical protein
MFPDICGSAHSADDGDVTVVAVLVAGRYMVTSATATTRRWASVSSRTR